MWNTGLQSKEGGSGKGDSNEIKSLALPHGGHGHWEFEGGRALPGQELVRDGVVEDGESECPVPDWCERHAQAWKLLRYESMFKGTGFLFGGVRRQGKD
jgi:hypothetical protein